MKIENDQIEALLLDSRAGNEEATKTLNEIMRAGRSSFINSALVDIPHKFSNSDCYFVFETTLAQVIRDFCFQLKCKFLSYFVMTMRYAFSNLAKSRSEYVASISSGYGKEPTALLRDCAQKDNNDLMSTLFTWKKDLILLASKSTKFKERDIRIINDHLDGMTFSEIAKKENCSLSTAKNNWKKFIDFAREILGVPAKMR